MAKFNPLVRPQVHLSRNSFDLSQRHVFSAKPGQLLPVLSVDTVPNDYFEIDCANIAKTLPVKTDAFARYKQNFEFFFVRYSDIWSNFDSFITQRKLPKGSYHNGSDYFPHFTRNNLINRINDADQNEVLDFMGNSAADNALRLADLLGYGSYYPLLSRNTEIDSYNDNDSYHFNCMRICAYHKIWYDYYRNKYYDISDPDVYTWSLDDLGQSRGGAASYQDYAVDYENSDRDSDGDLGLVPVTEEPSCCLFQMRYRQWKKDLFTSSMPSRQMGLVSSIDFGSFSIFNLTDNSVTPNSTLSLNIYTNELLVRNNPGGTFIEGSNNWRASNAFDVYKIVKANALQKWKETVLRAGDSLASQYKARFGVTPKSATIGNAEFLYSYDSQIEINPIYATAESAGVPLGEIAGRGSSVGQGKFSFKADDYGVLMCIYSLVPESEYDAAIDKQNTFSSPFDLFNPEFEDLGMEPVHRYQLTAPGQIDLHDTESGIVVRYGGDGNDVIGYTSRYSCYKTAVDRVHGGFQSRGYGLSLRDSAGVYADWVSSRADLANTTGSLQLSQIYISPFQDKSIMQSTGLTVNDDNFLIDSYFNIKAVRPMSVLGLPNW